MFNFVAPLPCLVLRMDRCCTVSLHDPPRNNRNLLGYHPVFKCSPDIYIKCRKNCRNIQNLYISSFSWAAAEVLRSLYKCPHRLMSNELTELTASPSDDFSASLWQGVLTGSFVELSGVPWDETLEKICDIFTLQVDCVWSWWGTAVLLKASEKKNNNNSSCHSIKFATRSPEEWAQAAMEPLEK